MIQRNLRLLILLVMLIGGKTQAQHRILTQEIRSGWQFSQTDKNEWLPAQVPGCVHTDLLANHKIEDPFYRLNEKNLQWIDKLDWEYKTTFNVDKDWLKKDRVTLDFKGLDTYAEIFVNNQKVTSTDNMFREYWVDIKKQIKEGENSLHIQLLSPIKQGLKKYNANSFVIPVSDNDWAEHGEVEGGKKVSVYTRKAGYHFGWDWGPRLVTSGIWRPVYLKAWDEARISSLQIVQHEVKQKKATFTAIVELETENQNAATIHIENNGKTLATSSVVLQKGIATYQLDFEITNPKLWWTNGLGDQPLYTIKAVVNTKDQTDELSQRIGIRTLELVRDKDKDGTSFYFKLNGVPVFMKGANYIPNDAFLSRVTRQNYEKVVNTAKMSNMNMLRVWGGGSYEDDHFYDLCDEAGILIWQDFMFACAMYPGDEAFLKNVEAEAKDNVIRLRNHPSIALWCGNNEILDAWLNWGWKKTEESKNNKNADQLYKTYENIFHKILPDAVAKYDSQRQYWSSSPSSGPGIPADLKNGDDHYWLVWWGKEPFKTYATHIARFMSEYGFQSFPELKTVEQFSNPEDEDIYSEVMKAHQRSSIGNETIEYYILQDYKKPKDFSSFLYVNQVLQAEGIKFALEGHRRAMPYCMGSLYWQINDCWPVASWSSTDYYQRWKALQYYVKKGFEPLLVSPFTENNRLKIGIVNDELRKITANLELNMIDFDGKTVWSNTTQLEIPKNSSATYFNTDLEEFLKNKNSKRQVLVSRVTEKGKVIANNVFYFSAVKDLELPKPNVSYELNHLKEGFEITLQSDKLAKNIYLTIGNEEGFFSDNYFDLIPGEKVKVQLKATCSMDKLNQVLKINTLDETY